MTLVVKATVGEGGVIDVGFLPTFINRGAQPEILKAADPRFAEVADYVRDMGRAAGLETRFEVVGDEVRVAV